MKPYIQIQKGEKVFIPKKYHIINDICSIIYDQMSEIYKNDNYKGLVTTDIQILRNDKGLKKYYNEGKNVFDWLNDNNLKDEIELILIKEILMAVTSELINFTFESLYSAKRGKMSVAYSLIRKPFTDLLLILEQIFVNGTDFIERFYHDGDPKSYDPSPRNNNINKIDLIQQALSKIQISFMMFDAEFIHDLRYNKNLEVGLNWITNHALHIVTNDQRYKTTNQNLNFVFSDKEDINNYYKHYYKVVPILLIYAASIVDGIVFSILKDSENQKLKVVK